jgi:hypothetical protein
LTSHTHKNFWKLYQKLSQNIREQAKKQYQIFTNDPYHASKPIYSARVTKDYRAVGVLTNDVVVWFWIGNHKDYEKLLKKK